MKADRKEYNREYYLRNRERKLAYQNEYYQNNREICIARTTACNRRRVELEKRKLFEKRYEVQ